MITSHTFKLEEVRVILIDYLNNIGDVKYIEPDKTTYEVTDGDDNYMEDAEMFTISIEE